MMKLLFVTLILSSVVLFTSSLTRVIELSDRFLELKGTSTWIVMFYAPWCGHCKKLEPIWNHVSQKLFNTEIRVGKVDCTKFTGLSTHYQIKGFPTILFIKNDIHVLYRGDRTKDEIIGFSLRMIGPHVPYLDLPDLKRNLEEHDLMFIYVGKQEGALWDCYYSLALDFRHFHYFFSTETSALSKIAKLESNPGVVVYKDKSVTFYSVPNVETSNNITALNESLSKWINNERFPEFMQITRGNLPQVWKVDKYLAIVVVEQNKIGKLASSTESEETKETNVDYYNFLDAVKTIIKKKKKIYGPKFHFGWTGTPELANSLAMKRLSLPTIVVIDKATMNYFEPSFSPNNVDEKSLSRFLDSILDNTAEALGGDSYVSRIYRVYFDVTTSLQEMWTGNPVLTTVLFGLPLGFLSLICYSIWCSDILDADESDEEIPVSNEKKNHPKSD